MQTFALPNFPGNDLPGPQETGNLLNNVPTDADGYSRSVGHALLCPSFVCPSCVRLDATYAKERATRRHHIMRGRPLYGDLSHAIKV